ncbi:MFS transporter [Leifsonia sp. NPDC080035]|uniref:MFS transporter n=1 Tax=Leifsonia sp. NPDC080035 TaxID=3143936 RepID=A0AAU7GEJ5_9MICO
MNIAELIAGSRMSRFQIMAIVVAIVLTVLEGYDTAMMVFAAPYVTKEFASSSSMIGVVLSGALIGMVIGSILVAPLADRIGRRRIAIVGTVIVLAGMLIAPFATDMAGILLSRIVTGLGVGALISVVGVIASEYSNRRAYPVVMAVYAAGINIGAVIGAIVIGPLLPSLGWRFAFWAGVVLSAIALILAIVAFPESIAWLAARRQPGTLDRVNRMLARMGHPALPELPANQRGQREHTGALRIVFSKRLIAQTLLMMVGYIAFLLVFYFANSWAPNTLAQATQVPSYAAPTTLSLGLGGVIGNLVFGFISKRVNPRILTPIFLVIGAIGLAVFGSIETMIPLAFVDIFAASFFFSAGVVGFYQIVPLMYPTLARATGYGIVAGAGRIGGIASPILAGAAFDAGIPVSTVFLIFSLPLVFSALTVVALAILEKAQRARAATAESLDPADGIELQPEPAP